MKKIFLAPVLLALSFNISFAEINYSEGVADIAEKTADSVVNISTVTIVKQQQYIDPFEFFFGNDMWNRYKTPEPQKRQSLGSGVIIDKKGYIVTNHHVVKNAETITVKLSNKDEYQAEIIGSDEKTDIAILKIKAENLKAVEFGNSDSIRVGEWAIAIGNPFGLSQTVTLGIISAKGRSNVGIVDYEDFIQTDAAINPGNSGGALLNIKGELIGINTAIFSKSGGYQGIGFAIPANMVKHIFESLIEDGKVERGWLGVHIQEINKQLAEQLKIKDTRGILISEVIKDSPAEKSGLKRGDVIISFDGIKMESPSQLRNKVASTAINKKVDVKIIRKGRQKTLNVKIEKLKEESTTATYNKIGAKFVKQDDNIIVEEIKPGSIADESGLRTGDTILEVNQKKIKNIEELNQIISKTQKGEGFLILIQRRGSIYYTVIKIK